MKRNKLIILAISVSLVMSSFSQIASAVQDSFLNNGKTEEREQTPVVKAKVLEPNTVDENEIVITPDQEIPLYEGEKEKLGDQDTSEKYNLSEKELKAFLDQGHTLEDIFKADELSNQYDYNPQDVLKLKKEKKLKWEKVEAEIQLDIEHKKQNYLKELRNKHKAKVNGWKKHSLTEEEQELFLLALENNPDLDLIQLEEEYKKMGKKNFKDAVQKVKAKKEKTIKSQSEAADLPEGVVKKLEKASAELGIPYEEMVEKFLQEKNKNKAQRVHIEEESK